MMTAAVGAARDGGAAARAGRGARPAAGSMRRSARRAGWRDAAGRGSRRRDRRPAPGPRWARSRSPARRRPSSATRPATRRTDRSRSRSAAIAPARRAHRARRRRRGAGGRARPHPAALAHAPGLGPGDARAPHLGRLLRADRDGDLGDVHGLPHPGRDAPGRLPAHGAPPGGHRPRGTGRGVAADRRARSTAATSTTGWWWRGTPRTSTTSDPVAYRAYLAEHSLKGADTWQLGERRGPGALSRPAQGRPARGPARQHHAGGGGGEPDRERAARGPRRRAPCARRPLVAVRGRPRGGRGRDGLPVPGARAVLTRARASIPCGGERSSAPWRRCCP